MEVGDDQSDHHGSVAVGSGTGDDAMAAERHGEMQVWGSRCP